MNRLGERDYRLALKHLHLQWHPDNALNTVLVNGRRRALSTTNLQPNYQVIVVYSNLNSHVVHTSCISGTCRKIQFPFSAVFLELPSSLVLTLKLSWPEDKRSELVVRRQEGPLFGIAFR